MKRLPQSKNAQVLTVLVKRQGYRCPLCNGLMTARSKKDAVLDHDHVSGHIRDALCRNCNGIEGKVFNAARRARDQLSGYEWLLNLCAYWKKHAVPQHGLMHHTHKTAEDKRLSRNKKARVRAAKLRAMKK